MPTPKKKQSNGIRTADGIPVYCAFTRLMDISEAVAKLNPRNPKNHPKAQLELYGKVIEGNGWRRCPVISKRSGLVTKGHGAILAAKEKGWKQVPVELQDYDSEAAEMEDMAADNSLSGYGEINEEALTSLLKELESCGENLDLTGFDASDQKRILSMTYEGEERSMGEEESTKVPREKEVFIVPIALTAAQFAHWEKYRASIEGKAKDKMAFLKLIGL